MESDLVRQYARMSDDELQTQFVSGQLDEGSLALLMAELNRRGLGPGPADHSVNTGDDGLETPDGFRQLVGGLSPLDAQILLGRLQAEGVDAHLSGANVTQTNPLWFQAFGGVRVFVRREHLVAALEVMNARIEGGYDMEDADEEQAPHVDRIQRKRLFGWAIVLLLAVVFGGMALMAIWSPSYEYFPYSMTPEPTSRIVGKWLLSALVVGNAAFWIFFVESAVRRQKRS